MHRWKFSALAAAAVLSAGLYANDASALALGRVTVQSALGEPLRAEIDLPQITASEAESLRATTASPAVFRAQGLEYSPTVSALQVQLQRRPDGSMFLRLSSSRPINDPFVDLVIDASWNAGQVVRSYTMLFDPPAAGRAPAPITAAPQVTPPLPSPPVARAPAQAVAPASPPPAAPAVAGTATPATRAAERPRATAPAAAAAAQSATEVTVRQGDTAGRLANAYRQDGVSLDQMLVAMMRANPDAFVRGNVNRLRSGAVLQIPDAAQAQAVPQGEARQIMAAQSRDFNEFRRRLAAAAPAAGVAAAERSASGSVQTQVEDRKPATAAPDKLTLSKGGVQAQKAEEQLAKEKQANDASARMAELNKNIAELDRLSAASSAPAGTPAAGASSPAAAASAAALAGLPAVAAPAPAAPASEPAAVASAADSAASAPAPAASVAAAPAAVAASAAAAAGAALPAPTPVEEPSFFDTLFDDPLFAGGALAIVLLLLGYGGYRMAQRRRAQQGVDSSFMESRLAPDSFFGNSGGQRVDTSSSELTTGSSMAYSPSQLDAGGDVDPVAEADVYLAYGRDLQAEEILKEAIRHNPDRTSVHVKLGEIYAKRQDRKAFENVARDVFRLTDGQGPDWARIADLGRELDAENPLYRPGGHPGLLGAQAGAAAALPAGGFASTMPETANAFPSALPPDLDLDLDLDLPGDALTEAPPAPDAPAAPPGAFAAAAAAAAAAGTAAGLAASPAAPAAPTAPAPAPVNDPSQASAPDFDLDLPDGAWDAPADTQPGRLGAGKADGADFDASDLSLLDSAQAPLDGKADSAPAPLEFDLGDLSLDLDTPAQSGTGTQPPASDAPAAGPADAALPDDPLATKLALAEEFNAIGDSEGARTLIEEVIAEASGPLKARAQRLLSELG